MNQNMFNDCDIIKVFIDEFELGMYVFVLDWFWFDILFLFQGFFLEDFDDLVMLCNICEYVYIDVLKVCYVSFDV